MKRLTRWATAVLVGSAMTAVGCRSPLARAPERRLQAQPIVVDDSVVHALDTSLEMRLLDRLELDHFLRDRHITVHVIDGVVNITGEVWTPLEKERVGDLVRNVAGVIDITNELDIHPPR